MEGDTSMPQNGRQQISSSATVDSPGTSTNGINQVATPNIPSTPNSEITPASNNSAGTSHGQSSGPNEDPESSSYSSTPPSKTSSSDDNAVLAAPNTISDNQDLESGTDARNRPLDDYLPLLRAALKGDWRRAEDILKNKNECARVPITTRGATALHIAVGANHTDFVEKWLGLITEQDAGERMNNGRTALHLAAQVGNVSIAKKLVKKNQRLPSIVDGEENTPLYVAAYVGHKNMVSYLFPPSSTPLHEELNPEKCVNLLLHTIRNDMYDIALKILEESHMVDADTECWRAALEILAMKPFAIGSESQPSFWKRILKYPYSFLNTICFKGSYNEALVETSAHRLVKELLDKEGIKGDLSSPHLANRNMALLFEAVKVGNVEFLIILSRAYPSLIWQQDLNQMSIFHTAIKHRQKSVFNLIYELGAGMHSLAAFSNEDDQDNMLHLAGKLAPPDRLNIVSGAALQMQLELLWFKEIEKIVPQSFIQAKNRENKTPKDIFVKEHKKLQKEGEKWMKDTANYCMIVATLIATVMFAAAFTVPGGNDQNNGTPIFFNKKSFVVFFISDAISLCSASTSIVIFLSILTSRYTKDDFLFSLPLKLLLGLATLFISIAVMMVAFIATFFLVYTRGKAWIKGVVITSACIPIIWFGLLHRKIWVDTFRSTCKSRFLCRPHKHRLF